MVTINRFRHCVIAYMYNVSYPDKHFKINTCQFHFKYKWPLEKSIIENQYLVIHLRQMLDMKKVSKINLNGQRYV